jgi:hypothetical protein
MEELPTLRYSITPVVEDDDEFEDDWKVRQWRVQSEN